MECSHKATLFLSLYIYLLLYSSSLSMDENRGRSMIALVSVCWKTESHDRSYYACFCFISFHIIRPSEVFKKLINKMPYILLFQVNSLKLAFVIIVTWKSHWFFLSSLLLPPLPPSLPPPPLFSSFPPSISLSLSFLFQKAQNFV